MLSNPLHRFPPYHSMPSSNPLNDRHFPQSHFHDSGLDGLSHGPHYALQHLQQHVAIHNQHINRGSPQGKHGHHPYAGRSASVNVPIRRRISRACDQCNQLRTKCDGQHPCAHCIEFGLGCEYQRERKKRGKASRKDLAQQAAAQAAVVAGDPNSSTPGPEKHQASEQPEAKNDGSITGNEKNESEVGGEYAPREGGRLGSADSEQPMAEKQSRMPGHSDVMERYALGGGTAFDPNTYVNIHNPYDRQGMEMMNPAAHSAYSPSQCSISTYPDMSYSLQGQTPTGYTPNPPTFRMTTSSLSSYSIPGDGPSPGWMDMSSPPQHYQSLRHLVNHHSSQLRYPVLEPLVPHLENVIPLSLACDLIDLYFSSSSGAQMHPMSPYVLGFVFRKRPFLHPSEPRRCQPALLASMLWVAAQTSDSSFLTSLPSARGTICQKLLELTVSLLKPLIHTPSRGESLSPVSSPRATDGAALGGLGVALPGTISMEALTSETGPFGAAGTLDDVVTYIHLATVVSASEYKGASLRWWNAAWSLARELRLGRELPRTMSAHEPRNEGTDEQAGVQGSVTEEEREERRRTWWLAYIVDRHLALCYNRPLFLLDIECDGLLQPMDDTAFQNGEFQAPATFTDPTVLASGPSASQSQGRIRGPSFECSGPSIYGYFLPLMTILGEIVDLNHARNHPRLGVRFRPAKEWDGQAMEIERHLGLYEQSLKMFAQRNVSTNNASLDDKEDGYNDGYGIADTGTPPGQSVHSAFKGTSRMTESEIQTRIVVGYGTHVSHVLHILLTGKWDPVNLLDDNDLWLSSQAFIAATGHAVSAARAASHILDYDPGLEFMPFFFGIYLLQGSFLLLLVAEKLRNEASLSVVKACETITRAHEACVVTLNTEYQRNFSRVMRSALAQVRGRVPQDISEQHQRRRELLALYRWTGDGTGLAI